MKCANHPKKDAAGACVDCGKLFCAACLVFAGKKRYCSECVAEKLQEKEDAPKGRIVVTQTNNQQVGVEEPAGSAEGSARGVRWVVSIFAGFISFMLFFSNPLSAFFLFLIFLLWLPPLEDYFVEKKLLLPTWARVIITFFLFVFTVAAA